MSDLSRYQIYLKSKSVSTLDDFSRLLEISRSKIIQDVVERVTLEFEKVINTTRTISFKRNPILKMAGMIKGTKPGISENIDEIYLHD